MLALIVKGLSTHQAREDLQAFIEQLGTLAGISHLSKASETAILLISQTKTEDETAMRQVV
jgi:hypothetical protein